MNNVSPNPFVPQGSNLEQKYRARKRFKIAFFSVLAINIVPIVVALLMQGCRKPPEQSLEPLPPETNVTPAFQPYATTPDTNVPAAPPMVAPTAVAPAAVPAPATEEYTVVQGDTFSGIAKKFPGLTVKQIQEANPGVEPTKLRIGQRIVIPAPTVSAPAAPGGLSAGGAQVYTVKSGDTLTKIAEEYGTTVKALRAENNLITDKIKVGDKLKIPEKAPAPATQ
jgi:LysM repeat protein